MRNELPLQETVSEYLHTIVTAQGNHFATTYDPQAASLILAAPDLLRACKIVLSALDAPNSCAADAHDWREIREMIAKAISVAES